MFGIDDARADSQLSQALALLVPMNDEIARAQREHRIAGVLLDGGKQSEVHLGGYDITLRDTQSVVAQMMLDVGLQAPPAPPALPSETEGPGSRPVAGDGRSFGLIISEGNDTFLLVGKGFTADFARGSELAEVDHVEEGYFDGSGWKSGRVLNGDERLTIIPTDHIAIARIRLLPNTKR